LIEISDCTAKTPFAVIAQADVTAGMFNDFFLQLEVFFEDLESVFHVELEFNHGDCANLLKSFRGGHGLYVRGVRHKGSLLILVCGRG